MSTSRNPVHVNAPQQAGWPLDWQRTAVTASSPNEQVHLRLVGDHSLTVEFAPGYYYRATTAQLEESFARAIKLLVVARTRAFYDALSRERGELVRPGTAVLTPEDADYRRRMDELPAEGVSPDGRLQLSATGTTHFAVRIAPGTLDVLDEPAFCLQAEAAGQAFVQEHLQKFYQLKFDVYVRPLLEQLTA